MGFVLVFSVSGATAASAATVDSANVISDDGGPVASVERKWNGAKCAMAFHSESFFGLARSTPRTVGVDKRAGPGQAFGMVAGRFGIARSYVDICTNIT